MIIQETPTLNLQFDKAKNDSDMLSLLKSQGGTFTRGSEVVGSGASVASYVDALGILRYAKLGHPRPNFVDGVNQGLLIEEERTNLALVSNDFSNGAWLKVGQDTGSIPVVTPNYTTAPDGSNNGWRLQCNLNGGNTLSDRSWLQQNITGTTVPTFTSVYAKLNSAGSAIFSVTNNGTATVTLTSTSWVRVGTVRTSVAASYAVRIGLIGGKGASDSIDISIAFAQLEVGSFSTSYIPTAGTTVTRGLETPQHPTTDILEEKGTFVFKSTQQTLASTRDLYSTGDFKITLVSDSLRATDGVNTITLGTVTSDFTCAVSYGANGLRGSVNGLAVVSGTFGTITNVANATLLPSQEVHKLGYYPEQLLDTKLTLLSRL